MGKFVTVRERERKEKERLTFFYLNKGESNLTSKYIKTFNMK